PHPRASIPSTLQRAPPPSFHTSLPPRPLHSFPTRRSSDLVQSDDHHVQANLPAAKTTTHTRKSYRSKSTFRARGLNRSSRIGLEDLSRPADARQQPSHDSVVRLAATALKLVLLDGPFGEGRGLICRLSLVLRKRHPLANDFPTRLVVFHVCGSLGCNFSTRLEATASFTVSRNSSGLVHAIRTASMWRVLR